MACVVYPPQIDVRFGDPQCEHSDMIAGAWPRDLICEDLYLFRQRLIGLDGQT